MIKKCFLWTWVDGIVDAFIFLVAPGVILVLFLSLCVLGCRSAERPTAPPQAHAATQQEAVPVWKVAIYLPDSKQTIWYTQGIEWSPQQDFIKVKSATSERIDAYVFYNGQVMCTRLTPEEVEEWKKKRTQVVEKIDINSL